MKKLLIMIMICLAASMTVGAQTQQGYVKTKGRLGSNGQVVAGKRLSGVTVQIKGRSAVVSGANGAFSFPIPANKFSIQSVKKNGYVLVDPEATARQYSYSTNPLVLVLETPSQQTDDKLANERKIRRTLQRQLQEKEDEIEALKAQNIITQEECQKKLQQLYAEQEDNEKLISDMAERYSQLDYDQLDEFNLRISDCILNGRLTEADSLLRTKGDINTRISRLNQHHDANEQAQETLDKSKAMEQKDREDIAQDCYHYYENFKMQHQNDSAARYLELRAALDTTNVDWQDDAGYFIQNFLADYGLAMEYYQRALSQAVAHYGEQSESSADLYERAGSIYEYQHDYSQALPYYQKSLAIRESVLGMEDPDVAVSLDNIGNIYSYQGDYTQAFEYFQKSLAIRERALGVEHLDVAVSYHNIGSFYFDQGDYVRAVDYYQKSLDIRERLLGPEDPEVAQSYNSIAGVYYKQGDFAQALDYSLKSLSIREQVFGTSHPEVAVSYQNIGRLYYMLNDISKALEYTTKAHDLILKVFGPEDEETMKTQMAVSYLKALLGQ